jgi:hypothetical protein
MWFSVDCWWHYISTCFVHGREQSLSMRNMLAPTTAFLIHCTFVYSTTLIFERLPSCSSPHQRYMYYPPARTAR